MGTLCHIGMLNKLIFFARMVDHVLLTGATVLRNDFRKALIIMPVNIGSHKNHNCAPSSERPWYLEKYGYENGNIQCRIMRVAFAECGAEKRFFVCCATDKKEDEHKITCEKTVQEIVDTVYLLHDMFCWTCEVCKRKGYTLENMTWPMNWEGKVTTYPLQSLPPVPGEVISGPGKLRPRRGMLPSKPGNLPFKSALLCSEIGVLCSEPEELSSELGEKGKSAKRSNSLTPMSTS